VSWLCEAEPVTCGRGGGEPRTDHAERFSAGKSLVSGEEKRRISSTRRFVGHGHDHDHDHDHDHGNSSG
jgi:hypothetical protein